jgi:predicted Zn-ribbon and HTH transcriptional regulator
LKKRKPQKPFIPVERRETVRRNIISLLEDQTLSAREISALVSISERDVYRKCGFEFRKREKLKKPGKCPICHNESILEPRFSLQRHE